MNLDSVCCLSIHDRQAEYANDLAKTLGLNLVVYMPGKVLAALTRHRPCFGGDVLALQQERVTEIFPGARIVTQIGHGSRALVVSNELAKVRQPFPVVAPKDEVGFDPTGKLRICVPLGNGSSGLRATEFAVRLAKLIGAEIFFWHTTWREQGNDSDDSRDHMCHEARLVADEAHHKADVAAVDWTDNIESVDCLISDGVVEAALVTNCNLIVMSRGELTVRGSHCDLVIAHSPIPVLVAG